MTGPDESPVPSLNEQADAAAREFRESVPEHGRAWMAMEAGIAAVPGRVLGADVEGQADELADAAARLVAAAPGCPAV